MKVVSVINYKGGVGKTIVTANLAAYVASQGKRVLMIDLDPQTSLTFSFMQVDEWRREYAQNRTLKNFFDPIIVHGAEQGAPLSSLIISRNINDVRMDIISSHLELIDIDTNLSARINGNTPDILASNSLKGYSYLRKGLVELKDDYDLILIDCPPNFYTVVKNAIAASHYYIAPAKMDYLSTLGIEQLDRNVFDYTQQYNKYVEQLNNNAFSPIFTTRLGVIPTMVAIWGGRPTQAAQIHIDNLNRQYHVLHFIRDNQNLVGAAARAGIPLVLQNPGNDQAMLNIITDFRLIGKEFMEKVGF